ncbi:hypothetical protein [Nostoc sp. T09]|nr:hypothetical protein [Nostoc sp. T09]
MSTTSRFASTLCSSGVNSGTSPAGANCGIYSKRGFRDRFS